MKTMFKGQEINDHLRGQMDTPTIQSILQILELERMACINDATDTANSDNHGRLAHAAGGIRAVDNVVDIITRACTSQENEEE